MTPEQLLNAQVYIQSALEEGRLTPRDIACFVDAYQLRYPDIAHDGKPGPVTLGKLRGNYPDMYQPRVVPPAEPGKFLRCPLPLLPGRSTPQVRKPWITSQFRKPDRPDHDGLDLFYKWEPGDEPSFVGDGGCEGKNSDGSPRWVVPYGTHAHAAADGTVQIAGNSPTGYRVWVNHGNGIRSGYFHLETLLVKSGDKVKYGTALGLVGHNPALKNGRPVPDGRHLHFEVSPVETYAPVNPELYLQGW